VYKVGSKNNYQMMHDTYNIKILYLFDALINKLPLEMSRAVFCILCMAHFVICSPCKPKPLLLSWASGRLQDFDLIMRGRFSSYKLQPLLVLFNLEEF
jgi:hypothetical protein